MEIYVFCMNVQYNVCLYVKWWSYYKYILYHISKRFFIALHWSVLMALLNVALLQLLYCIMSVYKWHDMLMMKCSRDLLQTLWNLNEERFKFELWWFFYVVKNNAGYCNNPQLFNISLDSFIIQCRFNPITTNCVHIRKKQVILPNLIQKYLILYLFFYKNRYIVMYLYIDPSCLLDSLYVLLNTCEQEALTWASHSQAEWLGMSSNRLLKKTKQKTAEQKKTDSFILFID